MADEFDDSVLFDPNYKAPNSLGDNEFDDSVLFAPDYQAPTPPPVDKPGDTMAGVYAGGNSFMSLMNYSKAAIGALTDNEDWMREGIKSAQGYEEKAASYGEGRVTDWDGVTDAGSFIDYFQYGLGTLAPFAAESMAAGVVGGIAGSAAAPGVGTVTGTLGGMVAKQALKETIKRYVKNKAEGMSKEAIERKIRKNFKEYAEGKILPHNEAMVRSAMKRASAKMGATMGSLTASLPIGQGDVASNMIEKDGTLTKGSAQWATGLAIPYSLIDIIPEFIGISRLLNPAGGGILKRTATGVVSQAPLEALTEVGQEEINIRTRAAHDPNFDPYGREAFVQRRESAILGGAGGAVFGGATGLMGGDSDIEPLALDVSTNIASIRESDIKGLNDKNQEIINKIHEKSTSLTGGGEGSSVSVDGIAIDAPPKIGSERRQASRESNPIGSIGEQIDNHYNEALKSGINDSLDINQFISSRLSALRNDETVNPDAAEEYLGQFPVEQQTESELPPINIDNFDRDTVESRLKELYKESKQIEGTSGGQTVPNFLAASGGISWDDAVAQGLDPADMKKLNKVGMPFGMPLFKKGGMPFDQAGEILSGVGVQSISESMGAGDFEARGHSANAVLDLLQNFVRGGEAEIMPADQTDAMGLKDRQVSNERQIEQFESQLAEVDEYENLQATEGQEAADEFFYGNRVTDLYAEMDASGELQQDEDVYYNDELVTAETEFDAAGEALYELYDQAWNVNKELAESEADRLMDASNEDIARAMYSIINGENNGSQEKSTTQEKDQHDESGDNAPQSTQEERRQQQVLVEDEQRSGERRVDSSGRKRVSEMSDQEKTTALLTNDKSGLRNERAYEEDERLDHQSFFDIDNFKQINGEYTYDGADLILNAFGDIMSKAGNDDVIPYHLHGDEFIVQSNSFIALKAFSEKVQEELKNRLVTIELPNGDVKIATNTGASYGIGETKEQAESNLKQDKAARAREGLRTERERNTDGLSEPATEGSENSEGSVKRLTENGYQTDAYSFSGEKVEVTVGIPAFRDKYQVTISIKGKVEGNFRLKNHLTREFDNLEDALEYAESMIDRLEPKPDSNAVITTEYIDAAASEAASDPSEGQKEAGNYKKGHIKIGSLDISIETERGNSRNPEWPPLANHYGYIRDTIGADKDHIDVFLSDNAGDLDMPVFVIDQVDPDRMMAFDEHKVMLGFPTEASARAAYQANYSDDWKGLGGITEMNFGEFVDWLQFGETTERITEKNETTNSAETDLLGDSVSDVKEKQTIADAKQSIDEKLSGTDDVPMGAGGGDLFGDANLQTDIEDFTGKPDNRSTSPEQLREKLSAFSSDALKETLKGSSLKQSGDKSEMIDRLIDAREAADVFGKYDTLKDFDEAVERGEIDTFKLQAWAEATHKGKNKTSAFNTQLNSKTVYLWGVRSGAFKMETGFTEAEFSEQVEAAKQIEIDNYPKLEPVEFPVQTIDAENTEYLPDWLVDSIEKSLNEEHQKLADMGYPYHALVGKRGLPSYLDEPFDNIRSIVIYTESLNSRYGRFMKGHKNVTKNQIANKFGKLSEVTGIDFDSLYKLKGLEKTSTGKIVKGSRVRVTEDTFDNIEATVLNVNMDSAEVEYRDPELGYTESAWIEISNLELLPDGVKSETTAKPDISEGVKSGIALIKKAVNGDINGLAGNSNKKLRQEIMSLIKGEKVPQAKAGINALKSELISISGINDSQTLGGMEKDLIAWIDENSAVESKPNKETLPGSATDENESFVEPVVEALPKDLDALKKSGLFKWVKDRQAGIWRGEFRETVDGELMRYGEVRDISVTENRVGGIGRYKASDDEAFDSSSLAKNHEEKTEVSRRLAEDGYIEGETKSDKTNNLNAKLEVSNARVDSIQAVLDCVRQG